MKYQDYTSHKKWIVLGSFPVFSFLLFLLAGGIYFTNDHLSLYVPSVVYVTIVNCLLCVFIYVVLSPYMLQLRSAVRLVVVQVGYIIGASLLYYILLQLGIIVFPPIVIVTSMPLYFMVAVVIIIHTALLYSVWGIYLSLDAYSLSQESYHLITKDYQGEVNRLRLQMNPHYLSNALNNLNSLLRNHDQQKAMQYSSEIIELLNEQLKYSSAESISVQEEISWLEYYLQVEKSRLNNTFDYVVLVEDSGLYSQSIPPMLIQPLIENSITHGFHPEFFKDRQGMLTIYVNAISKSVLSISVEDNGVGILSTQGTSYKQQRDRKSISIENIEKRIELINKIGKYRIKLHKLLHETGGKVTLIITSHHNIS